MEHADIWELYQYPNPPIMALILKPLALLPVPVGAQAWFYLKCAMTLAAFAWAFRLVESPGQPFPLWAKALTVVLSLRPIMGDLIHGNINLFILFLVMAALNAFHRGRDFRCGLILALAIACKVTPLLFVPYLLWKRSWKALAGCAAGLVMFLILIPGLFLGMERNVQCLKSWERTMVRPYVVEGKVTSDHVNQSLPGVLYRLGTHSPSFYENDVPKRYDNLANWDPQVVRWILKGCMLVFVGLVVWNCRTPTIPRHGWRLAAEFSLILLGMLLFSERTWKHHCVTLLLPFTVLAYYWAVHRPQGKLKVYLIGTLVAVVLLMFATSRGVDVGAKEGASAASLAVKLDAAAKLAQVYGAYVWAYILLAAALIVLLRRKDGWGFRAPQMNNHKGLTTSLFTRLPEPG